MAVRLAVFFVLAFASALLAKPEKGIVPLSILDVGTLKISRTAGTPKQALEVWLKAHAAHKAGREPEALAGYVRFLGMAGHASLPKRYAEMATERIEKMHEPVRARFEANCKLYGSDRHAALAVFKELGAQWAILPEGAASVRMWHSDAQRAAIDKAREQKQLGKGKEAIAPLEKAIRDHPRGQFFYEATTLLFEIGGPDLRPKQKPPSRQNSDDDDPRPHSPDDDDGPDSEIEIND